MNELFKFYLRKFVLIFFDDILVYSANLQEHLKACEDSPAVPVGQPVIRQEKQVQVWDEDIEEPGTHCVLLWCSS